MSGQHHFIMLVNHYQSTPHKHYTSERTHNIELQWDTHNPYTADVQKNL